MAETGLRPVPSPGESAPGAVGDVPFAVGRAGRPDFVPAERYYDPEFARLERAHLWPRVWQMACRLEEIPAPGDFVEYSICDQSILVVRVDESTIGAYQNACRHRATQLATGSGSFDKGRIICPFHGWRWNLEGENTFVYGPHAFDAALLAPEELCLRQVRVDTWGGCVWINLDPAAPSLLEALDPLPRLLDPLGVADMRVNWWKSVMLRANWKMAQEAFMEGYHVPQTHPQLTLGHPESYDPDSLVYSVYEHGHSSFQLRPNAQAEKGRQVGVAEIDAIIESVHLLNSGLGAMTMERDVYVVDGMRNHPIPKGSTFGTELVQGDLPVRRGRRDRDAPTGPRGARPLGRDVLPLPQLLRPPPVRERALLPVAADRGRSGGVPLRALVGIDSRWGRRRGSPGRRGTVCARTTKRTGRASRFRTSPTSSANSAGCTPSVSTVPVSRTTTNRASPPCTASSTATSHRECAPRRRGWPLGSAETDVVVVGTGGAALVAAIAAHDGGARVRIVEKSDSVGGTTAVSGGGIWMPRTTRWPSSGSRTRGRRLSTTSG